MTVQERIYNLTCQLSFLKPTGAKVEGMRKKLPYIRTDDHPIQLKASELIFISPIYPDEVAKDLGDKKESRGIPVIPEDALTAIVFKRQGEEFTIHIAAEAIRFARYVKEQMKTGDLQAAENAADTELKKLIFAARLREKAEKIYIVQDPDEVLERVAAAAWKKGRNIAQRIGVIGVKTGVLARVGLINARRTLHERHNAL